MTTFTEQDRQRYKEIADGFIGDFIERTQMHGHPAMAIIAYHIWCNLSFFIAGISQLSEDEMIEQLLIHVRKAQEAGIATVGNA